MKLTSLLMFGTGYVLGTRAGRERYAQIIAVADRASKRLEEYSERHETEAGTSARGARRRRAAV